MMNFPPSILAFLAVASSVLANIFSKKGSQHLEQWKDFFSMDIFLCIVFYVIGTASYLLLLRKVPLSSAYPLFSLTLVIVILFSRFYFNEPINSVKFAGIVFILLGILCIAWSTSRVA